MLTDSFRLKACLPGRQSKVNLATLPVGKHPVLTSACSIQAASLLLEISICLQCKWPRMDGYVATATKAHVKDPDDCHALNFIQQGL